jgi:hypothetical protein
MTDTETNPPRPARQGQAWASDEDRQLYDGFLAGRPISTMASVHERSAGGIRARLRRLGLITENGEVVQPPPPFAPPERRRTSAMEDQGATDNKRTMRRIFAVTAADGWRIEIKSNRQLDKSMVERVTLMLQGGIVDVESDTVGVTKRVVCLANSRKLQGRCIAARELVRGRPGPWLRPVSDRPNEEISEYERQYADGSDPRLLDVIEIPLLAPRPKGYQRENWLLNPSKYWLKVGQISWEGLALFADRAGELWINGYGTNHGVHDYIPLEKAEALPGSLKLVRVETLQLRVFTPGEAFGSSKRRVQARFTLAGIEYALWVTDPAVERAYLAREDGSYRLGESYLTISLGEPFNGNCHKLVAAVIIQR